VAGASDPVAAEICKVPGVVLPVEVAVSQVESLAEEKLSAPPVPVLVTFTDCEAGLAPPADELKESVEGATLRMGPAEVALA
jgi:hypothetical protein